MITEKENLQDLGIDFYRKEYFLNGRLRFPFACPELLSEYYNLALAEFLAKQKKLFGVVFNERNQTDNFILQEIKRNEEIIKEHKTYIERYNKRQWTSKERTINILETYIQYIKNQPQQNKDEIIKNEAETIFKNDIGFTIFSKMFEIYKDEKNTLANFSFLFYVMEKDFLVCNPTKFINFLRGEKFNIDIEKIDSRQSGTNKKTNLYNSIKERYTIKAQ